MKAEKVRFTKHATEKIEFLRKYGFHVTKAYVKDTVVHPHRVDQRNDQNLAVKPLNDEYALRVVYERTNDNIVVITFYPVKRKRFNV
jgi:hypothetical protein